MWLATHDRQALPSRLQARQWPTLGLTLLVAEGPGVPPMQLSPCRDPALLVLHLAPDAPLPPLLCPVAPTCSWALCWCSQAPLASWPLVGERWALSPCHSFHRPTVTHSGLASLVTLSFCPWATLPGQAWPWHKACLCRSRQVGDSVSGDLLGLSSPYAVCGAAPLNTDPCHPARPWPDTRTATSDGRPPFSPPPLEQASPGQHTHTSMQSRGCMSTSACAAHHSGPSACGQAGGPSAQTQPRRDHRGSGP